MNLFQAIHDNALRCARQYQRAEGALIDALQKVDSKRVYSRMGYASLFDYSKSALHLSESTAYAFIRVARKCVEIPRMKEAINEGKLTVSHAKRIAAVVTPSTQLFWISKASELSQRELDKEIAKELPAKAIPERFEPKSSGRLKLEVGISEELEKQIRRVQDILSQKRKHAITIEEALGVLCQDYLKRNDPLELAKRLVLKPVVEKIDTSMAEAGAGANAGTEAEAERTTRLGARVDTGAGARSDASADAGASVPNTARSVGRNIQHQVRLNTGAKCTAVLPSGKVCGATRWLDFHHLIQRSQGGQHRVENLTMLCSSHHRAHHDKMMG